MISLFRDTLTTYSNFIMPPYGERNCRINIQTYSLTAYDEKLQVHFRLFPIKIIHNISVLSTTVVLRSGSFLLVNDVFRL
jgi:hypothetical protein